MSRMLDCLEEFFSVYTTTKDSTIISCFMTEDAQRLGFYAFNATNEASYKYEYTEEELCVVRKNAGGELTWTNFFRFVTSAFNNSCVVAKEESDAGSTRTEDRKSIPQSFLNQRLKICCYGIPFVLPSTTENMQSFIFTHMLSTQQIMTNPKGYKQTLVRITSEAAAAQARMQRLDKEAQALRETLARNMKLEKASKQRLAELLEDFNPAEAQRGDNPWDAIRIKQQEIMRGNMARTPNPLVDRTCKKFNMNILRLIKSRWLRPEECDRASPAHRVVQPYSPDELAVRTVNFVNSQEKAIWQALEKIDDWEYNVFDVQVAMTGDHHASLVDQSCGGSFFVTMYALFCRHNFPQLLNLDEQIMLNWISVIEAGYHGNPYHNSMHAADVAQITHYIITKGGLANKCNLTTLQVCAALLAASIHDFDHPGINNNFHIKTGSHLATQYNDRSVLENLHVSSVFELMKNAEFNILANFDEREWRDIREVMIEMILATDMSLHGKYVSQLKSKLQKQATFTQREDQILALAMALKMADISNCGRSQDIYLIWSEKIADEFYQQGDRERKLGMTCSPFMDRFQPALAKGQISFINFIIIPFFVQLAELLPDLRFTVYLAEANKAYWVSHDESKTQIS